MVRIEDCTLVFADTANHALVEMAIRDSIAACRFSSVLLLSDRDPKIPGVDFHRIAPINDIDDYSDTINVRLRRLVTTGHVLIAQWDGFVAEPQAWTEEFRAFDYIGARWGWYEDGMTVGNGGFSLRSAALLDRLRDLPFEAGIPEDHVICRTERPTLEKTGIRFAPEAVADRFAFERTPVPGPAFGFHGLFNFGKVLGDRALEERIEVMDGPLLDKREYTDLMTSLALSGRKAPFASMVRKLVARRDETFLRSQITEWTTGVQRDYVLALADAVQTTAAPGSRWPAVASPQRRQPKIYDCFTFHNELDLLELRFRELYDTVDQFVIVEAKQTFAGAPKPLHFMEERDRFLPFLDKVKLVVAPDFPETDNPWVRERAQRNAIALGLDKVEPDDIIVISDVDEILRARSVASLRDSPAMIAGFRVPCFYFKFNFMNVEGENFDIVPIAVRGLMAKTTTPQQIRECRGALDRYTPETRPPYVDILPHAGWHFSYIGDDAFIRHKIQSFAHQELNRDDILDGIDVPRFLAEGRDIFNRPGYRWQSVELNDYFPATLLGDRGRWADFIAEEVGGRVTWK
ncbi:DUF5672 family protein [Azospirillum brasilense]|uniref:DUF5672 family protein n=1 Tax=Azospirillum brasilense TaxID=192 RepID=UPI001EDB7558|nr:DUF5672 family protein [Azospirillum brasilense]UKJ74929.1 N-acetylglucosaminyltransferase [Azospirillum brasilense]